MSKSFDSMLNELIDNHPEDWVRLMCGRLGIPVAPFEVQDTDLSATLQPDKIFRLQGSNPGILHLEFESSGKLGWPAEALRYNAFAHLNHRLPVHSLIVLLRPQANASDLTGEYVLLGCDGREYLRFRYDVLRVWLESADTFLDGGVGLAPLALLTNEAVRDLPSIFGRFQERLQQAKLPLETKKNLYGSTFVLSGLRHDLERLDDLYRRLSMTLEDSCTYQLLVERGRVRGEVAEAQKLLLLQGNKRFGDCTPDREQAIRTIQDVNRLERMALNLFDARSWDELLATP